MIFSVHAVSRNTGSSPRLLRIIDGIIPISENWFSATIVTLAKAMMPKASGNSSRVKIRFAARRMIWPEPKFTNVSAELLMALCIMLEPLILSKNEAIYLFTLLLDFGRTASPLLPLHRIAHWLLCYLSKLDRLCWYFSQAYLPQVTRNDSQPFVRKDHIVNVHKPSFHTRFFNQMACSIVVKAVVRNIAFYN